LSTAISRLLKNYCGAGLRCCRSLKMLNVLTSTPRFFARVRRASRPHDVFQRPVRICSSLLAVLLCAGCSFPVGLIYSDITAPYSTKFTETPAGTKRCVINSHQVKEPVTGYNIYAEWSWSHILSEARKAGITEIQYMDKRTLSILNGIYKRESLIVYGD
jgi:hypothetical protein